jgi:hypothetical protein
MGLGPGTLMGTGRRGYHTLMKRFGLLVGMVLAAAPCAAVQPGPQRRALLADIADIRALIPGQASDSVNVKYRKVFADLETEAKTAPALSPVRAKFTSEREGYFNALYKAHHDDFVLEDDKYLPTQEAETQALGRFKKYMSDRMDVAVTLRKLEESKDFTAAQKTRIAGWREKLDSRSVAQSTLDGISLSVGTLMTKATSRVSGGDAVQFRSQYIPVQRAPESRMQPPPQVEAVALAAPSESGLSGFITKVVRVGKGYAAKVADAIFDYSEKRNLDARLVAGLVWAESAFNATVGSWAACVGLGQLSEGVAKQYGVSDRKDIAQNLKGTTGFLSSLIEKYSTRDERAYMNGLYADAAIRVRQGAGIDATFAAMWPKIPDGMKNAVASYNAGSGAVGKYGGWDKLPLPRAPAHPRNAPSKMVQLALGDRSVRCYDRPDQDNSYCQTMGYIPKVLKNYFTIVVETTPSHQAPAAVVASADAIKPSNG